MTKMLEKQNHLKPKWDGIEEVVGVGGLGLRGMSTEIFFNISDELWGTRALAITLGKKEQNCLLDLFFFLPFFLVEE